ncbi:tetratricopeptide repeat protein [Streptomyces sp. YIM 98790]|uniref:tetratricopeptide repeat protein n=1 Tax=Streptomyces sp. YIM 98790 TaxID=2689077 RepID=UPI00140A318D|nr:tetratricopeptide repeat protein [Streptomyces sp. YIM 98790]
MDDLERLTAALESRLERVEATQNLSPVLEPEALAESERLNEIAQDDDLGSLNVLGWFHWYRYQALPEDEDQEDFEAAVDSLTPCFLFEEEPLPQPLLPLLADRAFPTAVAFLQQAPQAPDTDLVSYTVRLWKRLLDATDPAHPNRAGRLSNYGAALRIRFQRTGSAEDLDQAVTAGQEAVEATRPSHRNRAGRLSNLGIALQLRYERTGMAKDLEQAIACAQEALDATPAAHPNRAGRLSNLGAVLQLRYERTGKAADLDQAIATGQAAVDAAPGNHPGRATILANLASALRARYERTGTAGDLDQAIASAQEAVTATPAEHPERAGRMSSLGALLRIRYEQEQAAAAEAADDLDHAGHPAEEEDEDTAQAGEVPVIAAPPARTPQRPRHATPRHATEPSPGSPAAAPGHRPPPA